MEESYYSVVRCGGIVVSRGQNSDEWISYHRTVRNDGLLERRLERDTQTVCRVIE